MSRDRPLDADALVVEVDAFHRIVIVVNEKLVRSSKNDLANLYGCEPAQMTVRDEAAVVHE